MQSFQRAHCNKSERLGTYCGSGLGSVKLQGTVTINLYVLSVGGGSSNIASQMGAVLQR